MIVSILLRALTTKIVTLHGFAKVTLLVEPGKDYRRILQLLTLYPYLGIL
jgi:hypothetical protein